MGPLQRYMRASSRVVRTSMRHCKRDIYSTFRYSSCHAGVIHVYHFGTRRAMQMPYVFRIVGVRCIEPAFPYYTWAPVDFGRHKWGPYNGTCGCHPVSWMNPMRHCRCDTCSPFRYPSCHANAIRVQDRMGSMYRTRFPVLYMGPCGFAGAINGAPTNGTCGRHPVSWMNLHAALQT